jgi:hypothetical protein
MRNESAKPRVVTNTVRSPLAFEQGIGGHRGAHLHRFDGIRWHGIAGTEA